MLTVILLLCGFSLVSLAAIVFLANPKAAINRWLAAYALSGWLWLLANLFANIAIDIDQNLLFSRLALIGAALSPLSFLFFCTRFVGVKMSKRVQAILFLPVVAVLLTTLTRLNVVRIVPDTLAIEPGAAYPFLILIVIVYFSSGIYLLVRNYDKSQFARRQQLYYILLGTVLTLVPGVITSGVLPLLGNSDLVPYGPVSTVFCVSFTALAIMRHRLLDIRFFVVRVVLYGISTGLITLIYVLPVVWLMSSLYHVQLSTSGYIGLALVGFMLIVLYHYSRRLFTNISDRLLYRYNYNTQDVLDELGNLLVRTIDTHRLQEGSKQILLSALGPQFIEYWLAHDMQKMYQDLQVLFRHSTQMVLLLDDVEGYHETIHKLKAKDVALVVRLRTTHGELGYMVLGVRSSGEPYTAKDKRLLGTAADEIAISMQNALHFEEIQQFNSTLQGRVDQATRELSKTNDKLKVLDETKDEFISMASHQLRTPLTAIKGYLSMVLEGDAGPLNPAQKKMLEQSFASSQRMVYLISDLLNLSRLSTGKFIIERGPVQLADIVEAEVAQLVETARSRDLTLTYHKPATFPIAQLDETKIHQVVMNFLDNAIYYTPAGGHITVTVQETKTAIEYKVADTGIGVPRHEQHRLFSKFYRAGNARQARPDGTGLGLFMAKKAIVAQGGTVIFTSEEGKGSTFGFKFSKQACMIESADAGEAPETTATTE